MKKKMILLAGTLICLMVVWSVMTGQRQQSYAEAELTDQDKIWIITGLYDKLVFSGMIKDLLTYTKIIGAIFCLSIMRIL